MEVASTLSGFIMGVVVTLLFVFLGSKVVAQLTK